MSANRKRDAESPLSGEDDDLKRRIIGEGPSTLVSLDEITDDEDQSDPGTDLAALRKMEGERKEDPDKSVSDRVDSLIGRMDRFMDCFATLHSTVTKNQRCNEKKFKCLEGAHNDLATKVDNSEMATKSKIDSLEAQLTESLSTTSRLSSRIEQLEDEQKRFVSTQSKVNDSQAKELNKLTIEQGFTNKYVHDCSSEIKECKVIIAGVHEPQDENVSTTALNSINKLINAALADKNQDIKKEGLRKLYLSDISNVYRIGKPRRGNFKRNIVVTFVRTLDKEMVYRAKAITKEDGKIKFFLNDDVSKDGRILKAKMRRVVATAKDQGMEAKLSGNRVVINSRPYHSNELSLLPDNISDNLKQEKEVGDGIVYRGDKSIFSNFFPARFELDGAEYLHVEQYYQHVKALHHNDVKTADRIMQLSNPNRIKSLGDNIEDNESWTDRRMLVLHDGARAKFEQNLSLQEELLSTKGKQLYEATTDRYFGCGIGYESKRWDLKDWPGENVAGLVIRKVRDDLLGIEPDETSDNTLIDIASDMDLESSQIMESGTTSTHAESSSDVSNKSLELLNNSSQTESSTTPNVMTRNTSSQQWHNPKQRGKPRGRGQNRGRGRGTWNNQRSGFKGNQDKNHQSQYQPQKMMSDSERNFLGIKNNKDNANNSARNLARNASTPRR